MAPWAAWCLPALSISRVLFTRTRLSPFAPSDCERAERRCSCMHSRAQQGHRRAPDAEMFLKCGRPSSHSHPFLPEGSRSGEASIRYGIHSGESRAPALKGPRAGRFAFAPRAQRWQSCTGQLASAGLLLTVSISAAIFLPRACGRKLQPVRCRLQTLPAVLQCWLLRCQRLSC